MYRLRVYIGEAFMYSVTDKTIKKLTRRLKNIIITSRK